MSDFFNSDIDIIMTNEKQQPHLPFDEETEKANQLFVDLLKIRFPLLTKKDKYLANLGTRTFNDMQAGINNDILIERTILRAAGGGVPPINEEDAYRIILLVKDTLADFVKKTDI
jgi:hypothetical protein